MAKKSPLQRVNADFGGKEKLVDTLMDMVDRGEESKEDLRTRLLAAANTKLLRLHSSLKQMSEQFGGKDQLVDAILDLMKRAKDQDYRAVLTGRTPVQLVALHGAAARRAKRAKRSAVSKAA